MTGQILVTLRKGDKIEEILPYLEDIAQPGNRIVFLVHYLAEDIERFQSKLTTAGIQADEQLLAEKEFPALGALYRRDVKIALDIYAGPLKKVVEQYTCSGNVRLVMIATGNRSRIGRVLQNCLLHLNCWPLGKSVSVLLLHPDVSTAEN